MISDELSGMRYREVCKASPRDRLVPLCAGRSRSRMIGYLRSTLGNGCFAHSAMEDDLDTGQPGAFVGRWYEMALHDRLAVTTRPTGSRP